MKAIIFGVSGQDGFYLKNLLEKNEISVTGVSRSKGDWIQGNVADFQFVERLIKEEKPDYIFHLAANSTTKHDAQFENHETISTGTLNLLESVYKYSKETKVFISGSALQFVNKGLPIKESDEFCPNSAYSVSRIQSVYAARYYRSLGLRVYIGYFFTHDSPLRSERHVNQRIVAAVKKISRGYNEVVEVGNIFVKKEFGFAGDIVRAVFTLINNDLIYESVIGTGSAYTIKDWLKICFDYYNLDWQEYVKIKENYKTEYDILISDPKTIFSLGWRPEVDIYELGEMMINYKNIKNK